MFFNVDKRRTINAHRVFVETLLSLIVQHIFILILMSLWKIDRSGNSMLVATPGSEDIPRNSSDPPIILSGLRALYCRRASRASRTVLNIPSSGSWTELELGRNDIQYHIPPHGPSRNRAAGGGGAEGSSRKL